MAGSDTSCGRRYGDSGSAIPPEAQHLMRDGLSARRAWLSATHGCGPWWNGGASHLHAAYPKSWFDRMGLVSLLDTQRRFLCAS